MSVLNDESYSVSEDSDDSDVEYLQEYLTEKLFNFTLATANYALTAQRLSRFYVDLNTVVVSDVFLKAKVDMNLLFFVKDLTVVPVQNVTSELMPADCQCNFCGKARRSSDKIYVCFL